MAESTTTEALLSMLHTDPETIAGVPSDLEIIESNPDLKKSGRQSLTPGERQGFLEMWRMGAVQAQIGNLPTDELEAVVAEYDAQAEEFRAQEAHIFDMRFLANAARNRLSQASQQVAGTAFVQDVNVKEL